MSVSPWLALLVVGVVPMIVVTESGRRCLFVRPNCIFLWGGLIGVALMGVLVGLGSIFTLAKGTSSLDQSVGSGQELAVIAAVVIGGTSIMGGRGSVLGTVLGALLVQTVKSGVTQLGWPSQLSDLFVGIFIVVAVGTDLLRRRARSVP